MLYFSEKFYYVPQRPPIPITGLEELELEKKKKKKKREFS